MDNVIKNFWDFKSYEEHQWFKNLVKALLLIASVYIILHFLINYLCPRLEYEYVKLDKDQMQQISLIYLDTTAHQENDSADTKADSAYLKEQETLLLQDTTLTSRIDSANKINEMKLRKDSIQLINNGLKGYIINDSCNCTSCTKEERIICYLWNEFNHKLDTSQIYSVVQYLSCASTTEATNFLNKARFKVKSYFWLIGPLVYLEIIFWTWFGVICSLLFNLGIISKNRTTDPTNPSTYFDSSEVPSQVAKLLYAPACTLVIILGYNFFTDQSIVDISSSKGVLVFAFIGGFYSSRLINFLDKLKEIILPVSSTPGSLADVPPLKNIVVQVQLDESVKDLWDSLKIDLKSLKVTLQKEGSTQQAVALNIDTNQWPLFIFDFVQPGNYILEALWNTIKDNQAVILQAKQKIEMKGTDQSVTLKLNIEAPEDIQTDTEPQLPAAPAGDETPVEPDLNKKADDTE